MDRQDASIPKFMQMTYRFVIAVMLIACCCPQSSAQNAPALDRYTIIGDVAKPNVYQWPPGERVTLQLLLQQSEFLGLPGKAFIRKANQPQRAFSIPVSVWSNLENPIFLNPGDTVVWRSAKSSNLRSGNVALLTDRGPQLQNIPVTGVDLGTLRESAKLPFNQPVVAHRNGLGDQGSYQMYPGSDVLHGDVLDVRVPQRPETAVPIIKPQQQVQAPLGIVRTVSNPILDRAANFDNSLQVPPPPQYFDSSNSSSITMPAPLPRDSNTLQIPGSSFGQSDRDDQLTNSSEVNQSLFEEVTIPSVSDFSATSDSDDTLAQLADEALNPVVAPQQSSSQSFLSGLFLFGLVLAIGLITIGIVRTRQEQRLHDQVRVGNVKHRSSKPPETSGVRLQNSAEPEAFQSGIGQIAAESINQFAVAEANPKVLNGDKANATWASPAGTNLELDDCPVLSVGLNEAGHGDQENSEPATVPFTGNAVDQPSSVAQTESICESPEATIDLTPWLQDNPIEGTNRQTPAAVVEKVDFVSSEQQTSKPSPDDKIKRQLLKSAPASAIAEKELDELILELPDVDTVRNALERNESVRETAAELVSTKPSRHAEVSFEDQSICSTGDQADADGAVQDETEQALTLAAEINHCDLAADKAITEEPTSTFAMAGDGIDSPQTIQDQEDIMARPPMTQKEAQYLEDLIQNRLPMELSATQLPLKISLFGKPEGPRRLRIDAAHTTIAAPHMASTAKRAKRREPVMAVKHDASQQQTETAKSAQSEMTGPSETTSVSPVNDSRTEETRSADSVTQRQPQSESQNSASGLDKALNFLEEQSKS